jgi:hydroxymethylpyrimidine pyrophosphatase-like HAD family hydrolase
MSVKMLLPTELFDGYVTTYICDTNENDGVAEWLEEILLCKTKQ